MRQRCEGVITAIEIERPGSQEIRVQVGNGVLPTEEGAERNETGVETTTRRALVLTELVGTVSVGDRVLLNTVAVELGLGTGGLDFVVAILNRTEQESTPPGHILKLRYTPLQIPVLAVEAPESPHHDALRLFAGLDDTPVVCLALHSQLPAVCAAARWALRECGWLRAPRITYVMTEGAALPLSLSRLVPLCKAKGLLDTTITTGQAFGGDYEAVNLYSGLAAAKSVDGADIIIVGQGPGNVGTGTPLGFSGIDQGLAINATASLGGIPIVVPRISFADPRARHQGLSHHTITVLTRIARAPALLPLPSLPQPQRKQLLALLEETGISELHEPIVIDGRKGLAALLDCGISVTTMGRSIEEENSFFEAAAAAGLLAAQLIEADGRK